MKVLLILVDGMRPDAMEKNPIAQQFISESTYAPKSQTVFPSVTLPCHVSLFHSVEPERHGTTVNTYAPQVRPIEGLAEVIKSAGKKSAMFYNWEQLRDITRPGSLSHSYFVKMSDVGGMKADDMVTDDAITYLNKFDIDFSFLYLGNTDVAGHDYGWMTEEYIDAMNNGWENIKRVTDSLPEDYAVIITADHGGHKRDHGTDMPEDMTIPLILRGKNFESGKIIEKASILDIAPTITKLLGIAPNSQWEGKSLI